ncbi:MAG: hypothetical protein K8F91_18630, partial [Candidatus Obscuribacterales bacterium]|nr:hypothetical protein [Candidatus Obscuribacterales bacterium]
MSSSSMTPKARALFSGLHSFGVQLISQNQKLVVIYVYRVSNRIRRHSAELSAGFTRIYIVVNNLD